MASKSGGHRSYGPWLVMALATASLLAASVGCSGESREQEGVGTVSQAVVTGQEELLLSLSLPEAASLARVTVAANQDLTLSDSVKVSGDVSVNAGNANVGVEANVGNLFVYNQLTLRDRAHVFGKAEAKQVVRGNSVTIDGGVSLVPNPPSPHAYGWKVSVGAAPLGDVALEPDSSRDLPPGKYGTFSVKPRGTVTLHSGTYVLNDFLLESQAKLRIDDRDGPVQVVVKGNFVYRGQISSAIGEIPQVLFTVQGSSALVESPFTGVLVAPSAQVRFQAALPLGHRAFIYGDRVTLEPGTKVARLPFDWSTVVGANVDPIPPDAVVRDIGEGDLDISVNLPADGSGTNTSGGSLPLPEPFRLRDEYTVSGGIIGNGTATFRYRLGGGAWQTCTYQGQSSSATPTTSTELIKGTLLVLQSCTDNLPPGAWRKADQFELSVQPSPGYGVIVDAPLLRPAACDDEMELLTVAKTREMREQFSWSSAQKVDGQNPDGSPTLFYGWVYVQNKAEALALKKLYIHVLSRPLFDEELLKFGGRCGSFTNPGDGVGMFAPVLIPGKTYNKLIDALTSTDVSGDRTVFEAVVLRNDVPAAARNANGSVNLAVLKAAKFHYLDYEPNPFADPATMALDGAGASKILTDTLAWVGQAARDVGETITAVLGEIDQLFRGEVTLEFHVRALTRDSSFGDQPMVRAWGQYAGSPLGATGMQVKVIQKTLAIVPITARGDTNINGKVVIDASDGADSRRSGLCVELRTRAGLVTDFLLANEICDLRGYIDDNDPGTAQEVRTKYKFEFNEDKVYDLHVDNTRLTGLYQSDDVFRYSKEVIGFEPKRARILSGYWAATFARKDGTRLFTPCLNYPNSMSEAILEAGTLGGTAGGALIGSVVPGLGTAAGAAVGALAGSTFASVVGNSDIVMTLKSDLRFSRGVMSHEYGHYMFCSLINEANSSAVDHVIWANVVAGDDTNAPVRFTNEAVADFFMGQVTSGSNYGWMNDAIESTSEDRYCLDNRGDPSDPTAPPEPKCWDENRRSSADGDERIARVATLFQDMFDGHSASGRKAYVPQDADAWVRCDDNDAAQNGVCTSDADCANDRTCQVTSADGDPNIVKACRCKLSYLVYSPVSGTGDADAVSPVGLVDRVKLPGSALKKLTAELADGMEPFVKYTLTDGFEGAGNAISNEKIFKAVNATMVEGNVNWCDRCVVLAVHKDGPVTNAKAVFKRCVEDVFLRNTLAEDPPEPNLRIEASDCSACPAGSVSDDNGTCQPCLVGEVVGNECNACQADAVLDGATMSFNNTFNVTNQPSGDNCPDTFWVEITNPSALWARGVEAFGADVEPIVAGTQACTKSWTLFKGFPDPATSYYTQTAATGVGSFTPCPAGSGLCLAQCEGLPSHSLTQAEAAATVVRFGTPVMPDVFLNLSGVSVSNPPD